MFSLPIVTNLVVNRKEKKEYDIKKDILMPEMGRVLKYQIDNSIFYKMLNYGDNIFSKINLMIKRTKS